MTNFGQYFTPIHVLEHMMKIIKNTNNSNITLDDSCCGTSDFINDMYKYIQNKQDIKTNNKVQYFTPKPVVDHIKKRILINTNTNTNTNTMYCDPCVGTGSFINQMYEYIHDKEEKKDERHIIYVVNKYKRDNKKYKYDNKRNIEKRKIRKIFRK